MVRVCDDFEEKDMILGMDGMVVMKVKEMDTGQKKKGRGVKYDVVEGKYDGIEVQLDGTIVQYGGMVAQ